MTQGEKAAVSVVIPTYRRHRTLPIAIRSALMQGDDIREIIVVDDNREHDDNLQVLRIIEDIGDSRIVYLGNKGERGGSASRNVGILHANAPFIAFLDDDDYWLPGKIAGQMALMEPGIVGVDCGYIERDDAWGLMLEILGDGQRKSQARLLAGYCPTSTSLVMLRRESALQAGLFDERIASFEDYDFWVRCAAYGDFTTLREPKCVYVQHSGYRLSVAVDARMKGLDEFLARWGTSIGDAAAVKRIRRHWKLISLATNARRALSTNRLESIRYAISALRTNPACQHGWQPLLFALIGFRLARHLSRVRNSTRGMSENRRQILADLERKLEHRNSVLECEV
jgi:glycosyltransferase involved in cell wall biosynthesis